MNRSVVIVLCLVSLGMSSALQAAPSSYGVWFDRDTVDPWQATYWGAVDGGTYNTGGVYDVVIRYHAVDSDTATMFATINGIQQGFWTDTWKNAQPDMYPAGLSFNSTSLDAMKIFYSKWAGEYTGTADVTGLTLNGTGYGDFSFVSGTGSSYEGGQGPIWISSGGFTDVWDLTAQDLVMSYTIDFSGLSRTAYTGWGWVFEIGLMPAANSFALNPSGSGWMGNCWISSAASPGVQGLNDKFDLQNAGGSDEWDYDVTVPAPGALLLAGLGSAMVGWLRRRRMA